MPDNIVQSIKDIAHKVSEDYIFTKKDMNEALVEAYQNGEIENDEVLKRICEHVNQNVYLSLFNDSLINKSNITFDIADFNKILPIIRESEKAMSALSASPIDYRSTLSMAALPKRSTESGLKYEAGENADEGGEDEQTAEMQSNVEKASSLNFAVEYRNSIQNFMNKVATLKSSEEQVAEAAFDKMAEDAKILVAKDDSIGDISKIAVRFIKESGFDNFIKVAEAYDMIHKNLVAGNYHVKTEFTKLSSMKINPHANILKPVYDFAISTTNIAGFDEMYKNASLILNIFNKYINEKI